MRIAAYLLLLTCVAGAQDTGDDYLAWAAKNKPQDEESIRKVARHLRSPWDPGPTIKALVAIGPKAAPHVFEYLDREMSTECRRAAARVLAGIVETAGSVPAHLNLIKALRDDDRDVREVVGPVVAKSGDRGIRALVRLGTGNEPETRRFAARSLAAAGKAVVPLLTAELASNSVRRRHTAAMALGLIGDGAATPALIKALDDEAAEVRAAAARAVVTAAERSVVEERLVRGLRDPDPGVAVACVRSLASFGPAALDPLLAALPTLEDARAALVERDVGHFGEPALRRLEDAAQADAQKTRRVAAECLGWFGRKHEVASIADTLARLVADPDPAVRVAAARALGRVRREVGLRAVPALVKALEDASVRAAALGALGDLAPSGDEARSAVKRFVGNASPAVAAAATYAHGRLGGPIPPAVAATRANLANKTSDPETRVHAALALGHVGRTPESVSDLVDTLKNPAAPPPLRAAAGDALAELLRTRRYFSLRRDRVAGAPAEVRRAFGAALKWLADNQQPDGTWSSTIDAAKGQPAYKRGVTALAVLAFLGAGYTDRGGDNPYRDHVRKGLAYLATGQDKSGALGTRHFNFLAMHALSTQALCEASLMTGSFTHRQVVWDACWFVERARNPYMAWRYEPRGGENDTRHGAVMVTTLRLGELRGFPADPVSFEGAMQWASKMTDPNFGQIGYNNSGGQSARVPGVTDKAFPADKSQAMTAAGIWTLLLGGQEPDETMLKGVKLCVELPPQWKTVGARDLYYWYWGSLALHEIGGKPWRKWQPALEAALLQGQVTDGAQRGSWPTETAWGLFAGRAYTTSIATLALLTPYRYPPGFWRPDWLSPPYDEAGEALRDARNGRDVLLRVVARDALARAFLH
jgi:HEAT repeat protein